MSNRCWIAVCAFAAYGLTCDVASQGRPFTEAQGRQRGGAAAGNPDAMANISREYVRLVLAMGQHDKDYVDAYYGPEEIKREAESARLTLDAIATSVASLAERV